MGIDEIVPPEQGKIAISSHGAAVASIETLLTWTNTMESTIELRRLLVECSGNLREVQGERNIADGN